MFAAIIPLLQSGATLTFAAAAVIGSLGFLRKKSSPAPEVNTPFISGYQIGVLGVMMLGVFLGYKLLKDVFT